MSDFYPPHTLAEAEAVIADLRQELVRAERRQTVYLDLKEQAEIRLHSLRWILGLDTHEGEEPQTDEEAIANLLALRAVLAGEGEPAETVAGTCECGAPPHAMHYRGCPYLPEGHPGAAPGEPPIYAAGEGGPAAEEDG